PPGKEVFQVLHECCRPHTLGALGNVSLQGRIEPRRHTHEGPRIKRKGRGQQFLPPSLKPLNQVCCMGRPQRVAISTHSHLLTCGGALYPTTVPSARP